MIVTCYYDIYNNPLKMIEYMALFEDIAISGLPVILFTDPTLTDRFNHYPDSIKVIGLPLDTFALYSIGMHYTRDLPSQRNHTKDTKEYLSLMNTKAEFILRGMDLCNDDTFIWIDYGILKIIKDKLKFINKLKIINEMKFNKIQIPGCWDAGRAFYVDSVNWRFCGGVFIIPREIIQEFYQHSKNILTDFCSLPLYKLTWEVNIWTIVERDRMKEKIDWYLANHNDSILLNI
jgi:hypothetical protein